MMNNVAATTAQKKKFSFEGFGFSVRVSKGLQL